MASQKMKAAPVATGTDLRNYDLAEINSENNQYLSNLQAHYLGIVFGLSPNTAVTVAELAFGSEVRA